MKLKLIAFLLVLLTTGCATPPDAERKAKEYLVGACYKLFTEGGMASYQHYARVGQVAFALASDGPGSPQACAKASDRWNDLPNGFIFSNTPMDQLEAVAIQRCELTRIQMGSVKSQCRVFARNNDIIWGQSMSRGMR